MSVIYRYLSTFKKFFQDVEVIKIKLVEAVKTLEVKILKVQNTLEDCVKKIVPTSGYICEKRDAIIRFIS